MDKMVASVERTLDIRRSELNDETIELKEEQKSIKGHEEAINKYKKELEMKTKINRKKIEDLQKSIEKAEKFYDKLIAPHDTALHSIEDRDRVVKSIAYDIERLERHLKILNLQAEGWVIYSIDRWYNSNEHLGGYDRNNYRPQGWYIIDIIAKPTGIYMRTTLSENYRKVGKPGEVSVTMVEKSSLTIGNKRDLTNIVTGHTCKNPKKIKRDE
jgi:hypothetical protein